MSTEKVEEMSKSLRAKDDLLESVEQKLEKERLESDSLKISLDEVRREKLNVQERLEMLHVEKAAAERSRANLQVILISELVLGRHVKLAARGRPLCLYCVARMGIFIMLQVNNIAFLPLILLCLSKSTILNTKTVIKHLCKTFSIIIFCKVCT